MEGSYMVFVMSEEQLKAAKAAETEKVEAQVEEAVEEISEEDLDGVVGGYNQNGVAFGFGGVAQVTPALK